MAEKQEPNSQIKSKHQFKIFQTFQCYFECLGFIPNNSLLPQPFNKRIIIGFTILGLSLILQLAYFFQGSHNFIEYTESIYVIFATIVLFIIFSIWSFQTSVVFEAIIIIENLSDGKKIVFEFQQYSNY